MLTGCPECHRPNFVNGHCPVCGAKGEEVMIVWYDVCNDYSLERRTEIPKDLKRYRRLVDTENHKESKWIRKDCNELHYVSCPCDIAVELTRRVIAAKAAYWQASRELEAHLDIELDFMEVIDDAACMLDDDLVVSDETAEEILQALKDNNE